jgi:hypothetical protein
VSERLPLTKNNACNVRALFSPSVRGRAAEGGRASFTHHLELGWAAAIVGEADALVLDFKA